VNKLPQAGAIPYRLRDGEPEYLLVTSQKGNWIFPKGIIDEGETAAEAARKETLEEAGARGRIAGPPLGRYSYQKWESECEVQVFLLHVESEEPDWLERGQRERAWFRYSEARAAMKKKSLLKMLDRAHAALTGDSAEAR